MCTCSQEKANQRTGHSEKVIDLETKLLGIMEAELKSESEFVFSYIARSKNSIGKECRGRVTCPL